MPSADYIAAGRSSTDAAFVNALRACLGLEPIRHDGRTAEAENRTRHGRASKSGRAPLGRRAWWTNDRRIQP